MTPAGGAALRIALAMVVGAMIVSAIAGGAPAQESILPGYWETTDHLLGTSKIERRCILPKDIAKVMRGPSNHIYTCSYPQDSIADGRISFRGECVDKKGHRYGLSGQGVYTHTTLQMSAEVNGRLFGLPLSLGASTDAHRIGDVCPPGSPGSQPEAR
jgi:Protein of unknown function (DUF3617)